MVQSRIRIPSSGMAMAVPPLPTCNACRTLTQAEEKTKGQEKRRGGVVATVAVPAAPDRLRHLIPRGDLLLRGPRPLPEPEAVRSSFHLLAQTDEQVAVTVKNETCGCGRTHQKAEEEHG